VLKKYNFSAPTTLHAEYQHHPSLKNPDLFHPALFFAGEMEYGKRIGSILLRKNGEVNPFIIPDILSFCVSHPVVTSCDRRIEKVLKTLHANPSLCAAISESAPSMEGSIGERIIRATLALSRQEEITLRHVNQTIISGLLAPLYQMNYGSCHTIAALQAVQKTDIQQMISDFQEILFGGKVSRKEGGHLFEYLAFFEPRLGNSIETIRVTSSEDSYRYAEGLAELPAMQRVVGRSKENIRFLLQDIWRRNGSFPLRRVLEEGVQGLDEEEQRYRRQLCDALSFHPLLAALESAAMSMRFAPLSQLTIGKNKNDTTDSRLYQNGFLAAFIHTCAQMLELTEQKAPVSWSELPHHMQAKEARRVFEETELFRSSYKDDYMENREVFNVLLQSMPKDLSKDIDVQSSMWEQTENLRKRSSIALPEGWSPCDKVIFGCLPARDEGLFLITVGYEKDGQYIEVSEDRKKLGEMLSEIMKEMDITVPIDDEEVGELFLKNFQPFAAGEERAKKLPRRFFRCAGGDRLDNFLEKYIGSDMSEERVFNMHDAYTTLRQIRRSAWKLRNEGITTPDLTYVASIPAHVCKVVVNHPSVVKDIDTSTSSWLDDKAETFQASFLYFSEQERLQLQKAAQEVVTKHYPEVMIPAPKEEESVEEWGVSVFRSIEEWGQKNEKGLFFLTLYQIETGIVEALLNKLPPTERVDDYPHFR